MIVTVTLNAAIDRTLLVPNFQLGQRHRASAGTTSAGGKGINVARAARRLGVPVVCTGLAGGRAGTLLVEELTNEGILNDFVRIRGESRTSTAVLDPTSNVYTEINEWGPEVSEDELDVLREKLAYLSQGAAYVVFAGSLREAKRRGLMTVLDSEGDALRLGIEAEPYLVAPNLREAEALVGHEFVDEEDLTSALDEIADLGARNVLITLDTGCYGLFREERADNVRVRARAPRLEAVSTVGAGDTLLAAFIAARMNDRSYEDAVRSSVAASAASVLEAGPGRFDFREAQRLGSHVTLDRLEPVRQDA
jgi:1-phosphofructokinase family hexose kinase